MHGKDNADVEIVVRRYLHGCAYGHLQRGAAGKERGIQARRERERGRKRRREREREGEREEEEEEEERDLEGMERPRHDTETLTRTAKSRRIECLQDWIYGKDHP